METLKPNAGDLVYLADGREAEYVARTNGQHIVLPIICRDDCDIASDYPEAHSVIFTKPPTDKLHAETAEALDALKSVKTELQTMRAQLHEAKSERDDVMKQLASHPVLAPLVEFIDGKLTHAASFSQYGGGIKIQTITELVTPTSDSDRRDGEIRLLALYGGWSGPSGGKNSYRDDLRWQLNSYRDGSGSNICCILGTSEANVLERMQNYLDREFPKAGVHSESTRVGWADSALKLGLRVPAALQILVDRKRADEAANLRKNAADSIARAERELLAAREKLVSLTAVTA